MSGDTVFSLTENPVLNPIQVSLLKTFFGSAVGKQFFLTGGTALAAFYLGHRRSKDFDFFTLSDFDILALEKTINLMANEIGSSISKKVVTSEYWEIYLEKENFIQRMDFVREQPVLFGERQNVDGVIVDSLENITTNKILTIYGRLEAKDYLDLYFVFKEDNLDFDALFEKTKKKDAGLHEFYFGNIVTDAVGRLGPFPPTLKPFDEQELKEFFLELGERLLKRIKPPA